MRENSPIRAAFLFLFVLVLVVGIVLVVYRLQSTSTQTPVTSNPVSGPEFVAAEICTNTFIDNFERDSLGPNYSIYYGALDMATVSNGKLVLNSTKNDFGYPTNSVSVVGPEREGDVQVEATLSSLSQTADNNHKTHTGISLYQDTLFSSSVAWIKQAGESDKVQMRIAQLSGAKYLQTLDIPTVSLVKVKMVRVGLTFTGYYDIGNGYQQVGTHTFTEEDYPDWMTYFSIQISAGLSNVNDGEVTGKFSAKVDDIRFGCAGDNSAPPASPDAKLPVYRFWSDKNQKHFYTISEDEKNNVVANLSNVWTYERVAFYAYAVQGTTCPNGSSPIYRFWSDTKQGHFYTISNDEKQAVVDDYADSVWLYERIAYCAYPTQSNNATALFRFWSDTKQSHFYTNSEGEKQAVMDDYDDSVWLYESIAYYVFNSAQ